MSTEPGNYFFIVAPHASANAGAGEHHAMAVTAGLKVGDHITVEPHDSQYLERQRVGCQYTIPVGAVSDSPLLVEDHSRRGQFIPYREFALAKSLAWFREND